MSSRQWLKSTKYNKYSDSDMFGYNNPIVKDDLTDISHKVDWSRFNNKTILITGANGHIASYLIYSFAYAIDCGIITADIIAVSRNKDKLMSLYAPLTQKKMVFNHSRRCKQSYRLFFQNRLYISLCRKRITLLYIQ